MGNNKIPDRWLDYKAVGEIISGTRFVAFKVPLKQCFVKDLEPEQQFTLDLLVDTVKDLGLVIDLTNTNRYYNPRAFDQWDIQHYKILCEGQKIPNDAVVNSFYNYVDTFLERNSENGKLIGVHCTHGLNRTGYLICRYMIERMGMEPVIAIERFNDARGHDMERHNYLFDLRSCNSQAAEVASSFSIEGASCQKSRKATRAEGASSKAAKSCNADFDDNWRVRKQSESNDFSSSRRRNRQMWGNPVEQSNWQPAPLNLNPPISHIIRHRNQRAYGETSVRFNPFPQNTQGPQRRTPYPHLQDPRPSNHGDHHRDMSWHAAAERNPMPSGGYHSSNRNPMPSAGYHNSNRNPTRDNRPRPRTFRVDNQEPGW